ncbi:MAG TPA: MarR family transcriptional regulator [Novosphingobium sp.]|nr:MarR family transcriptional regulator [Novosphingobium sp.]
MSARRTTGVIDIEATDSKKRHIGLRLGVVARMLRNNFDRQVANLGVTRSQWAMAAVVSRWPGATQRVIAEKLEMSEASAGRLIDRLCSEGLLERKDYKNDRRARAVFLTDAAEPMLATLAGIARSNEDLIFAGFSDDELETLGQYLDRVYENVSRM